MLTIPIDRVDIKPFGDDGAFYSVALKRGKSPLDRFMKEDNTIVASEMLKNFREEVKKCVKTMKSEYILKLKLKLQMVSMCDFNNTTISFLDSWTTAIYTYIYNFGIHFVLVKAQCCNSIENIY